MVDLLNIKNPSFIKELSLKELQELAEQIREFLITNISKTGGHLSSNLGVVEITIAMHYVFDLEKDKLLFDVGHQSYVHKILTGRAKDFTNLREWNGISGYINRHESCYDIWESGHSSTSISAMAGMMLADNEMKKYVTLIGDSSITCGIALEGLNFLGNKKLNPIIILNDNKMGISKSVGALTDALSKLKSGKIKRWLSKTLPISISNCFHKINRGFKKVFNKYNMFEDLGFDYYGPINGNDLKACIKALKRIKNNKKGVILHIQTQKGKGYSLSEEDTLGNFHGVEPFDIETGKPLNVSDRQSYSNIVATYLLNKRKEEQFFVVTPAMTRGAKLEEFASKYPNDFYDVGIAEEHAAIMSAGIALNNKKVVLLYYATFAQRAYDYLLNDIARQNLNVIIGVDRAGVVGEDGSTHQGIYDISMFEGMPNVTITMPKDAMEVISLFNYAFKHSGPIVIRYPRKDVSVESISYNEILKPSWEEILIGEKICVITYGDDVFKIKNIALKHNLNIGIINARFIRPIDENLLNMIINKYDKFIILEQIIAKGTLYHKILAYFNNHNIYKKVKSISFDENEIIHHGKIDDVLNHYGMSEEDILKSINEI